MEVALCLLIALCELPDRPASALVCWLVGMVWLGLEQSRWCVSSAGHDWTYTTFHPEHDRLWLRCGLKD